MYFGPIAQRSEQRTHNPLVAGSNPAGPTQSKCRRPARQQSGSVECLAGNEIPIEHRSEDEVLYQSGITKEGEIKKILVCSPGSPAMNPAFDVTPARYITGIITEKGIYKPDKICTLKENQSIY